MSLKYINDANLLESYRTAIQLKLDDDFVSLLKEELARRNLLPNDHISN
ncbi:sporulation histidine kinase inhibitor Sda [Alkalihalophilus lindianensis]|uniref:Sporulation histidine kinase inhibitor Sda n=1 Tax=Alkalihalophilus lindianensis TaxID=1630542 RepID=A0ABU3XEV3_9BACI|nr:sporulation histidine kinase inhibitor Sda [Alkalihalophilus lindianensis]MDV2686423.1 sporulation histidine kinase inhibitor Sda [Alkalihalophilus lindianensis]